MSTTGTATSATTTDGFSRITARRHRAGRDLPNPSSHGADMPHAFPAPNASDAPVPQAAGAVVTRRALAGRSVAAVTLGEATAQRVGGGDVFAIRFDKHRRTLVFAVRSDPAPGRPPRLRTVTIDVGTGAILQVEVLSRAPKACPGMMGIWRDHMNLWLRSFKGGPISNEDRSSHLVKGTGDTLQQKDARLPSNKVGEPPAPSRFRFHVVAGVDLERIPNCGKPKGPTTAVADRLALPSRGETMPQIPHRCSAG
jgi:hypothetical protein